MTNPKLPVFAHTKVGLGTCTACHEASALQGAHKGVKPGQSEVAQLKLPNDFCFKCHGSYDALASQTVASTVFKTPDDRYINPHSPPDASHASDIGCFSCHELHGTIDPLKYCYKCHMAKVLECNTCHGPGGVKD
jgi:hypothetical protein